MQAEHALSVLRDLGNIQYSPVTFILELITISYAALIPRRINLSSSNAANRTDTSVRTVWQRIVPPSWKPRQDVPAGERQLRLERLGDLQDSWILGIKGVE